MPVISSSDCFRPISSLSFPISSLLQTVFVPFSSLCYPPTFISPSDYFRPVFFSSVSPCIRFLYFHQLCSFSPVPPRHQASSVSSLASLLNLARLSSADVVMSIPCQVLSCLWPAPATNIFFPLQPRWVMDSWYGHTHTQTDYYTPIYTVVNPRRAVGWLRFERCTIIYWIG